MSRAGLLALRKAYRMIFDRTRPLAENLERAKAEFAGSPHAEQIITFMDSRDKRHFCLPPVGGTSDDSADDDA
jgi:UDP-N-acetylglucosamine acyltransferase